jgi:CBS domain-containing membrane protein
MAMRDMSNQEVLVSIIGAFIATLLSSFFSYTILSADQMPIILASTGASAVLIFGLPHSPVSRPWHLVGGHLVSAVVGVTCQKLIASPILASSLAIAFAMLLMHYLRCIHPPGGATAVTAVIGGEQVEALGYAFVLLPVFFNMIILLSIAMAVATLREKNPFYPEEEQEVESKRKPELEDTASRS